MRYFYTIIFIAIVILINLMPAKFGILNLVCIMVYLGQVGSVAILSGFGSFGSSYHRNLALIPFSGAFFKALGRFL